MLTNVNLFTVVQEEKMSLKSRLAKVEKELHTLNIQPKLKGKGSMDSKTNEELKSLLIKRIKGESEEPIDLSKERYLELIRSIDTKTLRWIRDEITKLKKSRNL